MQLQNNKKIAYLSLFIALAMILSYVESTIPINFGIPGVKIGLANAVSLFLLYCFGFKYALIVMTVRVVLTGFLFGNMFSIIYSFAGGIISLVAMLILKRINKFSIIGVSMGGGVFHNLGQLLIAVFSVKQLKLAFYGPILIVSGLIMGLFIGMIGMMILKRIDVNKLME